MTDMSTAEIKDAFDLPINATALGYYVNVSAISGCVFSVQIMYNEMWKSNTTALP